jgi:deoxyribodipyrimidine photo-lyase
MPDHAVLGFEESNLAFPQTTPQKGILERYHEHRDLPAIAGTSRLSVHFRFGTISIRAWAQQGRALNEKWLNELIWRDFYQMILWHFPETPTKSFKPAYDKIEWERDEAHFEAWQQGKTGYPLVDAGMRELLTTGFMHNRVRMVVASFLCKHLLLDWRWGEQWFARKLLDFEQASNVGGWQWAAGSGNDAAPYFRVFNPTLQLQKFDPQLEYVKKWVPEWGTPEYPQPIVEHTWARNRALDRFQKGLSQ